MMESGLRGGGGVETERKAKALSGERERGQSTEWGEERGQSTKCVCVGGGD